MGEQAVESHSCLKAASALTDALHRDTASPGTALNNSHMPASPLREISASDQLVASPDTGEVQAAPPAGPSTTPSTIAQPSPTAARQPLLEDEEVWDAEVNLMTELIQTYLPVWSQLIPEAQRRVLDNTQQLMSELYHDQTQFVALEPNTYHTVGIASSDMSDVEYQALLQPYLNRGHYTQRQWKQMKFAHQLPPHVQVCFFRALRQWTAEHHALAARVSSEHPEGQSQYQLSQQQEVYLDRLRQYYLPVIVGIGTAVLLIIAFLLWIAFKTGYNS